MSGRRDYDAGDCSLERFINPEPLIGLVAASRVFLRDLGGPLTSNYQVVTDAERADGAGVWVGSHKIRNCLLTIDN